MAARPSHIDIFCRVIDNFGDAGTCWRLARQLAVDVGIPTRLVIDQLDVAKALVPAISSTAGHQVVSGVTVQRWQDEGLVCDSELVIEAFACELPVDYLETMTKRRRPPVWFNLEYLSAELWVIEHHKMPSPHPRLPLTKYFFFPGLHQNTGGLLREQHILEPIVPPPPRNPLRVFAFTYAAESIEKLCSAIDADGRLAHIHCFGWHRSAKLKDWQALQGKKLPNTASTLEFAEFVPQSDFDAVLMEHDLLLVRGEDSLVRALWSGKPFIWQLYKQEQNAHLPKLEAFLECYGEGMPGALRQHWLEISRAWNGIPGHSIQATWPRLRDQWQVWADFAQKRAVSLMRHPDLASNLLSFFEKLARI